MTARKVARSVLLRFRPGLIAVAPHDRLRTIFRRAEARGSRVRGRGDAGASLAADGGLARYASARDPGWIDFDGLLVQEQDRAECVILRGGADVSLHGQVRQERIDLGSPHLLRVTFVVEEHERLAPVVVGIFGADRIMLHSAGVAPPIQQPGRLRHGRMRR